MRKASKLLKLVTLLTSLACLTGCGIFKKDIVLHPIEKSDIVMVSKGETLVAPKDGAFLSSEYISSVMEAKVKNG